MYDIGQLIVYSSRGVCRVKDIQMMRVDNEERLYYKLEPLFQDCSILIPTDSSETFVRPIMTREEAENLIDQIPTIHAEAFHSHATREVAEHYEAVLNTHDTLELLEMTMSIYAKKKYAERHNRKFGSVDEHFMKRAEDLLFGELSAALCIPRNEVQQYISQRVRAQSTKVQPVAAQ